MKNYALLIALIFMWIIIGIAAFSTSNVSNKKTLTPTPTTIQSNLEPLGEWEVRSGHLYSYKVNGDTIYIIEGRNSSYPVSMQVK
jgi:hypothetical protein